jgi:CheY-like chemotaxis protein
MRRGCAHAVDALEEFGYTMLSAETGTKAIELLANHPEIGLLFTDVVIPDMNGRQLAQEARRRLPCLKVLFTTGYTRNAIVHNGMLDPGVSLPTDAPNSAERVTPLFLSRVLYGPHYGATLVTCFGLNFINHVVFHMRAMPNRMHKWAASVRA